MLKRILHITVFLTVIPVSLISQTGGNHVYEFLNLTCPALTASLGGTNVSVGNGDINMAYGNPALLTPEMSNTLGMNYVSYFAGINYGMCIYSLPFPVPGNFAGGVTYLNYGSFREADEAGNITGSFRAAEYALSLIWSKEIDSSFRGGITARPIISHLEKYTSLGLSFDIGISWQSGNKLTSAGLVVRNAGFQITTYASEEREKLPFEIQAGISHRLAHAPFRFSLTLRHLEKFNLIYDYNNENGAVDNDRSDFAENLMRHVIAGAEIIPHKNFYVSVGYNYQRRRELQVESKPATVGFSWGFGINTSLLSLGFGRATFHLAGASNHFSLIIRPDLLYIKLKN